MLRNKLKILISSVLIATTLFAGFTFLKRPTEAPKQINKIESNEQKNRLFWKHNRETWINK